MSCCGGPNAETLAGKADEITDLALTEELRHAGKPLEDGTVQFVFSVPEVKCAACISTIERHIAAMEGVLSCRVNLTLRRVTFVLDSRERSPLAIVRELEALGYPAMPLDLGDLGETESAKTSSGLLRALAVAGFAASNVMLLSVSIWSGAEGSTRDLFHLISALIAIPAVAYSGQVFFRSAWSALSRGRLNMDVPISLAVILALGMSVFETLTGGEEAYFDAAVTLLFFLLIGRYLDNMMRERARSAVVGLGRMAAKGASVVGENGGVNYSPIDEIRPGMVLRVAPGERVPVNAVIVSGKSHLDRSLVTGENAPVPAVSGKMVEAGTLNLTGLLTMRAVSDAKHSFLAEVMEMLEAAETGRGAYVRIADRMAQIYAPAVHLLAAIAFVGWMIASGGDWHLSLYIAISVLIITCPCALGLAVPVVHVIGAARLFEEGILVKDGAALERMAEGEIVVFDKTGTLTTGAPVVASGMAGDHREASLVKTLALNSIHPASRAIANWLETGIDSRIKAIREVPGFGVEGMLGKHRLRLGRPDWVGEIAAGGTVDLSGVWFALEGEAAHAFMLDERLREDAGESVACLMAGGREPQMLSGDNAGAVAKIAAALGIESWLAGQVPADKIAHVKQLQEAGRNVIMIGDGLNDAPSLAAAHVSMAPASASDVGRAASDFVFTRESLMAVPFAKTLADKARTLIRQNFGLAILYNCIAVPLALAGFVTPLFAAIAMSASSIVVVANSLRLARHRLQIAGPGSALDKREKAGHNGRLTSNPLPRVYGNLT
jgi:Cu2+-exporting ATPase